MSFNRKRAREREREIEREQERDREVLPLQGTATSVVSAPEKGYDANHKRCEELRKRHGPMHGRCEATATGRVLKASPGNMLSAVDVID